MFLSIEGSTLTNNGAKANHYRFPSLYSN